MHNLIAHMNPRTLEDCASAIAAASDALESLADGTIATLRDNSIPVLNISHVSTVGTVLTNAANRVNKIWEKERNKALAAGLQKNRE
jgi:hypothetical protein